jgi:PAS domain S-box-containing protein
MMPQAKHISILRSALEKRKESNPRYSLRAFASFLGLHPSALSRVLSGKQDLSVPSALQILRKLKLNQEEQELFIVSVGQEKSRQTFATLKTVTEQESPGEVLRDGEARVLAELKMSQQLLKTVFSILPMGSCVVDGDGHVVLQNPKMKEYLPNAEIPSRSAEHGARWISYAPDGSRIERKNYPAMRALRGESVLPGIEMLYKPETGYPVWTRVAALPLRDENGKITGAVALVNDIDAQKRYQEVLMASEEHMKMVANIVPDLLWNSSTDGHRTWFNARWMEYTGQTYEEAIGMGWVNAIHPDDRESLAKNFREAVLLRQNFESEHRIRKVTGEYRRFLVRAAPVKDARGEVVQMYGAATDVHELLKNRTGR